MTRSALRRSLWGVAAFFGIAGSALFVAPTPKGGTRSPSVAPPAVAALPVAADSLTAEEIVLGNVFSPTRTPPTTRYSPVAEGVDSVGVSMGTVSSEAPSLEAMSGGAPALFGTLVDDAGTRPPRALLLLDPASTTPRLYGVGEGDGGYRVISIAPRAVVLGGPAGRVTLRLDPEEEHP